jgi:hypothetical protein
VTDDTFDERYAFFYRELAPHLRLYRYRVGDTLSLRSVTRNGYVRSSNVKVYGVYGFDGLEKSPQAGMTNMTDLVTFRELYGFATLEGEKELEGLRKSAGIADVSRADAERVLFGEPAGTAPPAAADHDAAPAPSKLAALAGTRARLEEAQSGRYDAAELRRGTILNAAVVLTDEDRIDDTLEAIDRANAAAGLKLRAVSWREAAGLLGQLLTLMSGVLFAAVVVISVVAMVVMNNALVMAALERVTEVGTLRAIGARRSFVFGMLFFESASMGLAAGVAGALAGAAIVSALGRSGIPATSDVMTFFFSGPRLFPRVSPELVVLAVLAVLFVSLLSGLYPALLATRVSPREAMQAKE